MRIPNNAKIFLDLNGFDLNRNMLGCTTYYLYCAIYLEGELTIKDSSETGTSKITGGYSGDSKGSAIYIASNGSLSLQGGIISNNYVYYGGGAVYVSQNATFTMTGGSITGNKVYSTSAGGVYVVSGGKVKLGGSAYIGNNTTDTQNNYIDPNKYKNLYFADSSSLIEIVSALKDSAVINSVISALAFIDDYFDY